MPCNTLDVQGLGAVQKSPPSKAAHGLQRPAGRHHSGARGAYTEYVSTEQWRERRWRLFSADPEKKPFDWKGWEHL